MAAVVGWRRNSERTEMEKFDGPGMALLPWPRSLFAVLWEQLRVLVQVIYCTFVSVVQMLRFEVHLTISDEAGQHIQHMSSTSNQTESFLFSTLFESNSGVMVGGSNPLSNLCADMGDPFGGTTTEALLSSLRADDLCCGLVDDLVARATGKDDAVFHQSSWNMGFPGEWNIFVSSSDLSGSSDSSQKSQLFQAERAKERASEEEEWGSQWSSEEDQGLVEFNSEESKALWESLSQSSDPYNPLFFTACISTNMGRSESETQGGEGAGPALPMEEPVTPDPKALISRSDSDISWSSSEGSSPDIDTELLDLFQGSDPYNPMCFTACLTTAPKPETPPKTATEEESGFSTSSSEDHDNDEEDELWKSLSFSDDPFHPLNFQAGRHSSPVACSQPAGGPTVRAKKIKKKTPRRPERAAPHGAEQTLVHWKKPKPSSPEKQEKTGAKDKKVRFCPEVQVHVMRSWLFARQASRRGQWEELARDRARFQRRIQQAEQELGRCFDSAHREKMRQYVELCLKCRDGTAPAGVGDPRTSDQMGEPSFTNSAGRRTSEGLVEDFDASAANKGDGLHVCREKAPPYDWSSLVTELYRSSSTITSDQVEELQKVLKQSSSDSSGADEQGPTEPSLLERFMSCSFSDASWSSDDDFEKESEGFLEFLRSRHEYGAVHFPNHESDSTAKEPARRSLSDTEGESVHSSGDEDEEQLWKSLCLTDDPHHPVNFQARLFSPASTTPPEKKSRSDVAVQARQKPSKTLVPWRRPGGSSRCTEENSKELATSKMVRFSPLIQVHVMRSWRFARQASRKGHWEEIARDRAHFQRRIQQVEQAIGHCFTPSHRSNIRMYMDLCLGKF
ncbi:protein phosphatase 1 regulatory subunit 15B [Synchiropus splendidus]|uniref:protein phosphatase 1 regulatory subunit 15B n=1 Tax=Synchiropus splendidus TaxID=270530 RepID=UPI00237EAF1E|nr:protein phosphatase 1 regulatory subunit 15B [Synchiropus splendidus]